MKRALIAAMILTLAIPALATEKWWDFYNRGVAAVRAKNYEAAAEALQRALVEMPNESGSARARNEIITYVPHFWLGIAKFNLGDADGALREWKISEEQGAVQGTQYYAQLRDWVARAQSQKQHNLEGAATDSKREANAAVGHAVSAQMDAVAAGADRTDRYRSAQRKLQEAMDAIANAGTDVRAFRHAAEVALQAHDLFAGAAEEAKRQKAAHPPAVARQQPKSGGAPPTTAAPASEVAGVPPKPQPQPIVVQPPPAPAPQPIRQVPAPQPQTASADVARPLLEAAYRAFASGDLAASEQLLSRILAGHESSEAYLLRGCVRYTRSMLARRADMRGATADFRAALKMNRALRLDAAAFSPKLINFFEQVKKSSS